MKVILKRLRVAAVFGLNFLALLNLGLERWFFYISSIASELGPVAGNDQSGLVHSGPHMLFSGAASVEKQIVLLTQKLFAFGTIAARWLLLVVALLAQTVPGVGSTCLKKLVSLVVTKRAESHATSFAENIYILLLALLAK